MTPDPDVTAAQRRYRDWLAARVEVPAYRGGPLEPAAYVDHQNAEDRFLTLFPEDEPYRRHLRGVGADWGPTIGMADGWWEG